MADDLGYADLGCYGGRTKCSPSLDRMAKEGLRFTQGYANSSVCSPTRFALMTGRWQHRLRGGADEPIASRSARGSTVLGLPPQHPTFASLLRDAGYGLSPYFRISFASSMDNLEGACKRIHAAALKLG